MIRIRSPTKKKLNRNSISDWKSNTSGRFFY
ncbi:conjugal transfer protein [Clostridioides difficile]|uniref:Conjugative transposon protein Tn1549-like, CTn2-Orf6 n=1 Tax=Clostridioides difficile (strain 630) TaxID=272563 RepID=Q188J9_CLOD6|nr:conjugal transfer protein [Clostridioides difficile]MCG6593291.1 conjugal transfer protein [Clostridioides difficile]PNL86306.1 conjugal transfer protein [Clostridioides difficile]CAJ67234.1 putative conjugative transposon protein Tn1549-like, CTn2-Orf6 [Clostridioides difficile 630]CEJ96931.1 putative conjugative transposon proteinTn1549-like, CTn2-Orf6 [Clostridioides difficile]